MKFELFGVVPVQELKSLSAVEDFTVRKEKLALPKNGDSSKGKFVCFLNTSLENIAKILTNDHPMVFNQGNSYRGYYYDHLTVRTCIQSKRIKNPGKTKMDLKKERLVDYGVIQSFSGNTVTPLTISTLAEKNFVYDMEPITKLLKYQDKLKRMQLIERLRMYFETIGKYYEKLSYPGYTKSAIFINLDEYNPRGLLTDYSFYDYMMILLKKSDTVVSRIMENVPAMDVLFYTEKGYILVNITGCSPARGQTLFSASPA